MSFISSFDIISILLLCEAEDEGRWSEEWQQSDAKVFLCIIAPADDAAVNPEGIKTFLTNGLITFFISGGPRSLPRKPPDSIILDIWVFDNLISVDKLFSKALRRFAMQLVY